MDNIGFIGLGNMGLGMANNILKNNNELNVFTRTKSKLEKLTDGNVIEHDSIKSIASKCNILLTCLPNVDEIRKSMWSKCFSFIFKKTGL